MLKSKQENKSEKSTTPIIICPICGTKNLSSAKRCAKCGYIFESKKSLKKISQEFSKENVEISKKQKTQPAANLLKENRLDIPKNKVVCKRCSMEFDANLIRCPRCGLKK